ncbi:hypothetical protein [Silvibacterium sp.]|uniref:hypothetical protein n=1 Tax=Silvibacterium sp. TaxID=1964179 RepID=UPI0039E60DC8
MKVQEIFRRLYRVDNWLFYAGLLLLGAGMFSELVYQSRVNRTLFFDPVSITGMRIAILGLWIALIAGLLRIVLWFTGRTIR